MASPSQWMSPPLPKKPRRELRIPEKSIEKLLERIYAPLVGLKFKATYQGPGKGSCDILEVATTGSV